VEEHSLFERVEKQEQVAKNFGFYWQNLSQLCQQIISECAEVQEAVDNENPVHVVEEVGDLIHATLSLSFFCGVNGYEALSKSIEKFQKRYDALVELAQDEGNANLHEQPFEVLMRYWQLAKKKTQSNV